MDATLYDELWRVEQEHWWFRARRKIVWSLVDRYATGATDRRLRVCDLGCGTGGNLAHVADEHDVVGVEYSPHALEYAQRRLGKRVRRGSLPNDIDLPWESFDVVLMTDVLEHIEDDFGSAHTALRLLRPGGIAIATVPAYQWLYSPRDAHHHHFRRYSKRRFQSLWATANAELLFVSHYNSLLFAPAAVARLASKLRRTQESIGDLRVPPRSVNWLLTQAMQSERSLLGRVPMPFGLSLVAVVRRQADVSLTAFRRAA